jgi:hypothetical protein
LRYAAGARVVEIDDVSQRLKSGSRRLLWTESRVRRTLL